MARTMVGRLAEVKCGHRNDRTDVAVRVRANAVHSGDRLVDAPAKLDALSDGESFVLGHNLISFDLPHLATAKLNLRLLRLPTVDTLRLSPPAFPRHPYHHLVKHYQDSGLKQRRVNDPELEGRLVAGLCVGMADGGRPQGRVRSARRPVAA